jgi:hypothetical protein
MGLVRSCCRVYTFWFFMSSLISVFSLSLNTSSGISSSFKTFFKLICSLSYFFICSIRTLVRYRVFWFSWSGTSLCLCWLCFSSCTFRVRTFDLFHTFCQRYSCFEWCLSHLWVEQWVWWQWNKSTWCDDYIFEVFNWPLFVNRQTVLHHYEVEVVHFQLVEDLLHIIICPQLVVHFDLFVLIRTELNHIRLNVELIAMVDLLLLSLLHPVVDWTNCWVLLLDGDVHPVVQFLRNHQRLDMIIDTSLAVSTSLRGNRPPVKLRTYLSVTYDLRLSTGFAFLVVLGTWGR